MSERSTGESLAIATLPNLRDVGGWPTTDGRHVRRGLLYRSVAPTRLDEPGLAAFAALRIATVFDLRTAAEREPAPDEVPAGTEVVALDVLADAVGAAPAQLEALLDDPARAAEALGGGRAAELMVDGYRQIVTLPSALASYRELYARLAEPTARPALIHCTTGKDRTGWGAAALLMLLGVSAHDVEADYLRTNDDLIPALQPIFDRFTAGGGDRDVLLDVLGVRARYLHTALREMTDKFGSIEGYFTDGLGVGDDLQEALRSSFLSSHEPAAHE